MPPGVAGELAFDDERGGGAGEALPAERTEPDFAESADFASVPPRGGAFVGENAVGLFVGNTTPFEGCAGDIGVSICIDGFPIAA